MRVFAKRRILEFIKEHADSECSLTVWYKIMTKSDLSSFEDLKKTFGSADKVKDVVIFNISGNKYRLIAHVTYKQKHVYIRHILTHSEYDKYAFNGG
jgi:mRNA interferase HigB